MRKFIISVSALGLCCNSAFAADLSQTAPPQFVQSPLPLWQGFYVGVQFGYGSDPSVLTPAALPPGFTPIFSSNAFAGAPQGVTAGGRVGYDWQIGAVVWGIESDFSWADFTRSGNETLYGGLGGVSWNETVDWWGSTNIRVGVPLLGNQALLYALGGVAYGNPQVTASGFVGPFSTSGTFGGTNIGWDVGGGLAVKVNPASEFFVEARWIDLGSVSGQLLLNTPGATFTAGASQTFGFAVGQLGYAYHF